MIHKKDTAIFAATYTIKLLIKLKVKDMEKIYGISERLHVCKQNNVSSA